MKEIETESTQDNYRKRIVFLLLALLLSFSSLAPGGPVENRDFSHLPRPVFNGFNAFLITLGLVGFLVAFFVWRGKRWAYWDAILVGWLFVIVVASDLGKVFPVSPDPTGFALGMIMIVDAILAIYVVLFSHKALGHI
jgi:hypothetical protein